MRHSDRLLLVLGRSSSDTTSAAGGNETDLLSGRRVASDGGRVTNVLKNTNTENEGTMSHHGHGGSFARE